MGIADPRITPSEAGIARRRTERILLRIPIEVRGTGTEGNLFKEQTTTLAINRHGARIVLRHSLPPGARIGIKNLQNNLASPFRVVGLVGNSAGEGPEMGVECLEPEKNFWGIFFPEKTSTPRKEEVIDILLECSVCHARELAQLTLEDYQTVTTQPSLPRRCDACAATTAWKLGYVQGGGAQTAGPPVARGPRASAGVERRRAKRVPVKLPVRVRLEEIGNTENLSTSGVCFSSSLLMKIGDRVLLTIGFDPRGNQEEVRARVVWRQPTEGTNTALYGVQLEEKS
jgi:hypothetical protein